MGGNSLTVKFRSDGDFVALIDQGAGAEGKSRSDFIRDAVVSKLEALGILVVSSVQPVLAKRGQSFEVAIAAPQEATTAELLMEARNGAVSLNRRSPVGEGAAIFKFTPDETATWPIGRYDVSARFEGGGEVVLSASMPVIVEEFREAA